MSVNSSPDSSGVPGPSEGWRAAVEAAFEDWGRRVFRHRWIALLGSVLATGWLVSFLPQLTVDNSTESFLLPGDPAVVTYNASRDRFGRDDVILLAVGAPDLFAADFLDRLRELHRAIEEEVPYIVEVDSLLNARVTRGSDDGLIVEELFEAWPETDAARERNRSYVSTNPLYLNTLVSADQVMTAIAIKPMTYSQQNAPTDELAGFGDDKDESISESPPIYLTAEEGDALVSGLHGLIERFERPDFRLHMAGALPMTHRINQGMSRDLGKMMPVAAALMCLVLAMLFRRIGGVLLPLAIVALSLVGTLGTMILLGIPGSTAVQILPIFLLTVGVCDAVHILALVYRFRMEGLDEESSVACAMGHSGLAILMTSVTTAAGLASFVTAEMAAVMHLGILAPIGVALAFVYTMVLLPALLAIFPLPAARTGSVSRGLFPMENFLVSAGSFAARHPYRILIPTGLLVVLGVMGALQVRFSHNGLSWFPEHDRVRVDFTTVDERLRGSVSLDLVIDAREPGGLYEPAVLEALDEFIEQAELLPVEPLFIGKTLSILDILKETHLALNENREGMRRIPSTRAAIAQELLLFENSGSEDTEEFVDSEYRRARISMRVPFADALHYPKLLADIRSLADKKLGRYVDYEMTGIMTLLAQIIDAVINSMLRSYIVALCVIMPMMMLLVGSLRRGLVSMVPNLLPVLAVLAAGGWLDIAFDSTTMMLGAMVIGIAVDDTIHFMHKFHRYFEDLGDVDAAIRETMRTTGSALLFTTLVLATGFTVFLMAEMSNMRIFGALAAMATLVAFAADLLVAPALLSLVEARRVRVARSVEYA
jgi:predicted RND superfamily exporter protein